MHVSLHGSLVPAVASSRLRRKRMHKVRTSTERQRGMIRVSFLGSLVHAAASKRVAS
jgi:hypothetical protein